MNFIVKFVGGNEFKVKNVEIGVLESRLERGWIGGICKL
jgi:hypothetical protein